MNEISAVTETAADIWTDARPAESRGITHDDIRDLWQTTWPALGDTEPAVFALALSDARTPQAEAAREALTSAYMAVVKKITATHLREAADREDMRQTALMGLWQGFREFNPTKGHRTPAATVQRNVIRALSDAHAARFAMSVSERDRLAFSKARQAAEAQMTSETAERAAGLRGHGWFQAGSSFDELAAALAPEFGLSSDGYWQVYRVLFVAEVLPSGDVQRSGEDSFLSDGATGTYAQQENVTGLAPAIEQNDPAAALVGGLLDRLTDREREVVERYYGLGEHPAHTDEEIGKALGFTKMRSNQIRNGALAKLREPAPAA
jgi:RNA polymerase sigma factor (sigma-70 family)